MLVQNGRHKYIPHQSSPTNAHSCHIALRRNTILLSMHKKPLHSLPHQVGTGQQQAILSTMLFNRTNLQFQFQSPPVFLWKILSQQKTHSEKKTQIKIMSLYIGDTNNKIVQGNGGLNLQTRKLIQLGQFHKNTKPYISVSNNFWRQQLFGRQHCSTSYEFCSTFPMLHRLGNNIGEHVDFLTVQ